MEFNLTSSDEIIARVMRDFKVNNINWKASGYDWIADGMKAINAWFAFETKKDIPVQVFNHKAVIPCAMIELIHVYYKGCKLPIGRKAERMHCRERLTCDAVESDITNYEKIREVKALLDNLYSLQAIYDAEPTDELAARIAELTNQVANYTIPYAISRNSRRMFEYYNLNPGIIETSFECGTIYLTYVGAMSDSNGLPIIPDVYEFKEALAWTIMERILLGGYEHPVIKWDIADVRARELRRAARNKLKMPSLDKMDALVKMWTNPFYNRPLTDVTYQNLVNRLL